MQNIRCKLQHIFIQLSNTLCPPRSCGLCCKATCLRFVVDEVAASWGFTEYLGRLLSVIMAPVLHICLSTVRGRSKEEIWAHLKSKITQLRKFHGKAHCRCDWDTQLDGIMMQPDYPVGRHTFHPEMVMLLTCIGVVPSSNLPRHCLYDPGFFGFPQPLWNYP
jgi:hypothetical protein